MLPKLLPARSLTSPVPPLPRQQKATSALRRLWIQLSTSPHLCRPTERAKPSRLAQPPSSPPTPPCSGPVSSTEELLHQSSHLILYFDPSRQTSSVPRRKAQRRSCKQFKEITVRRLILYVRSVCGLLYLGRKMALWRKFSNFFKKRRSAISWFFSSGVFWQAQHWAFSDPDRSDLVGLVLSSMSVSPVAEIRVGIFSSVLGETRRF